ncbi:DUF3072 domain-containing protein [Pseudonocardia xishanensis]|uniref:DUF3072 domain-containing protein n=1 Tax=Pseudonocardia xishanensis TaxID=630995 RepID=A0ABP8S2B1_9PSEU
MTDRATQDEAGTAAAKDPDTWTTGDEPITGAQRSYLETLSTEAGEEIPEDIAELTKAEASKRIDELQDAAGRG